MRRLSRGMACVGLACAVFMAPLVASGGAEQAPAEPRKPWLADVAVETYTLSNGLTVILHEDHKAPLVAVHLTYNVGSKDDPPGRTGLAHLFEHLMFEGSQHSDSSYTSSIYRYLAASRGTTGHDRTDYYQTVTPNALERVLWLEADRMGFLLPALTKTKLDNARKVVANERWQNLDEVPYGEVAESWTSAFYPPGHPYRYAIIGSVIDLSSTRLRDLKEFYQKYYAPNNAFLCVAGDFESTTARSWIQKYFGPIRPGTPTTTTRPDVPALVSPVHIALRDRVSHAYAGLIWPTVPANHPDEAALDVLAAVLGGESRWNRLFRALRYDRQLATEVSGSHPTFLLSGTFEVNLFARSGQKLEDMVKVADAEIERLKRDGPTSDEVRRVKIERRRLQSMALDSVASKASVLCNSTATHGDPLAYRSVLAKIFAVTPEDVKRVARAYLGTARIEVDVQPGTRAPRSMESQSDQAEAYPSRVVRPIPLADSFDRSVMPEVGAAHLFVPPAIERRQLSNGLEIRIVERHELPMVRLKLVIKSGAASVVAGKDGLSLMTVNLLEEGTKTRSALQLESDLIEIGALLSSEGLMESSTVSLTTPARNLERAVDLFADVIFNPALADDEYLRLKLKRMTELEDRADNAEQIAVDVLPRLLYPADHPYARSRMGTLDSVPWIAREDIIEFYKQHFVPGNASLVVVGDVQTDGIARALEARFGTWRAGPVPPRPVLSAIPTAAVAQPIYVVDRPGAAQSVVSIGRVGAAIRSPGRPALVVLRDSLSGRISTKLRDQKARTYGFAANLDFHNGPGPFVLRGSVSTVATKATLVEIFKEMHDLAGGRAVTDGDVSEILEGKIPDWIDQFETTADVAARIAYLVSHRLPDNHYSADVGRFEAVTATEINRLALRFLAPWRMTILIVGDRARIEKPLRSLAGGKIMRFLDSRGNPVSRPSEAKLSSVAAAGE